MKNLFERATAEQVQDRIGQLGPGSERQWGKMSAAQALAHCSAGVEWALGDTRADRIFVGRLIGRLIKPKVLGNDEPMRRNSPTAPSLIVGDDRELVHEKDRLRKLIDRFCAAGPQGNTPQIHSFFGQLSPDEWAILMYKHLDHHLRQFGA